MWRYELKFIIDPPRQFLLNRWQAQTPALRRQHPMRLVNSLYYDAPDLRAATENLMGLAVRRKTRLRWYGHEARAPVRLEVKEKNGRLGRKTVHPWPCKLGDLDRRAMLDVGEYAAQCGFPAPMSPTLQVTYAREYFLWDAGIRVTLDRELEFSNPRQARRRPVRDPNAAILEVKFAPGMKALAQQFIAELPFYPVRHSKYLRGLELTGRAVY